MVSSEKNSSSSIAVAAASSTVIQFKWLPGQLYVYGAIVIACLIWAISSLVSISARLKPMLSGIEPNGVDMFDPQWRGFTREVFNLSIFIAIHTSITNIVRKYTSAAATPSTLLLAIEAIFGL